MSKKSKMVPPTRTAAMLKNFHEDKELGYLALADWLDDQYGLNAFAELVRLTQGKSKPENEYHYSTPELQASLLESDVFAWMAIHDSTLEVGVYSFHDKPEHNVSVQFWYRFAETTAFHEKQKPTEEVALAFKQLSDNPLVDEEEEEGSEE